MSQKKLWQGVHFEKEVSWVSASDLSPESNVIGIGTGFRMRNGKLPRSGSRELCITFYVSRKHPKSRLAKRFQIAPEYDGIPTDVIEVGVPRSLTGNAPGANPVYGLCPGSSIGVVAHGNHNITGTLGAFVRDAAGRVYILSNNHILADDGNLSVGAQITFPSPGDALPRAPVATLHTSIPLQPFPQANQLDCGLAEVLPLPNGLVASNTIRGIGSINGVGIAQPGSTVLKLGRSNLSPVRGIVAQTSVQMYFSYPHGMRMFSGLMSIIGTSGPFAVEGDSGSLIIDAASARAVGLLTSGASGFIFANHLSSVLAALKVGLV